MEEVVESKICHECQKEFAVYEGDLPYYKMFDVPVPDICFDCRLQRRLAYYNRRNLYRRICDHTGEPIISMYSPDKPFKVFSKDAWYSDHWDGLDYGREFDFSRPFFEQYYQLFLEVPLLPLAVIEPLTNSAYTNDNASLKNCYLCFDCSDSENVLYGESFTDSRDSMEILYSNKMELCYECIACSNCYNLNYSRFCTNCYDSWFLRDCIGCNNCFGCANLRQKEYHIFNKKVSKAEYEKFISEFKSGDLSEVQRYRKEAETFFRTQPIQAQRGVQNINATGDYISKCKNAFYCFNCEGLEDSRYCTEVYNNVKDCMDIHVWGNGAERCYNSVILGDNAQNVICSCFIGVGASNIAYSFLCTRDSHDLFGCIGLQKKRNCILNKHYSDEEYHKLRNKIIAHMKETGEWGSFFPPSISPFGYNESLAFSMFPRPKDEILAKGWKWSDYEAEQSITAMKNPGDLPANIDSADDKYAGACIQCELTEKPFRVVTPEFSFYKRHKHPLPRRHPDQRHLDRIQLRNQYRLFDRACSQCGHQVSTSNTPERRRIVFCQNCYDKAVA